MPDDQAAKTNDEIDWKIVDQLHDATLKISNDCFEYKKTLRRGCGRGDRTHGTVRVCRQFAVRFRRMWTRLPRVLVRRRYCIFLSALSEANDDIKTQQDRRAKRCRSRSQLGSPNYVGSNFQ